MKRRQKAGFLCAISSRITLTKENERRKRKIQRRSEEEERRRREKKEMVALLVFIMATFLAEKRLLDRKSPSGGNVFKNPAKYIFSFLLLLSFPLM